MEIEKNNEQLMERLNSSSMFLQSNDMRVTEVRQGYAKVEMIIDEQILNIHGFVHGGALFSLADTVAGAASFATGRDSVTLTGTAEIIADMETRHAFWKDFMKHYFPGGPDDPDYCILCFHAEEATFWIDRKFKHIVL